MMKDFPYINSFGDVLLLHHFSNIFFLSELGFYLINLFTKSLDRMRTKCGDAPILIGEHGNI